MKYAFAPSARSLEDSELAESVLRAHRESRSTYGRPRIHAELRAQGRRIGQKRVARLMKAAGISGVQRRRYRKTTDSAHDFPIAPNTLARRFDVTKIETTERFSAGDITYIATHEGWLYLSVVLDLVSRRVVGWSMRPTMERALVIDALRSAIANKRPGTTPLFHSDRGSQYASTEFRAILVANGLTASMSRKGECWDNAVVESFFGTMKTELGVPLGNRAIRLAQLHSSTSKSGITASVVIPRSATSARNSTSRSCRTQHSHLSGKPGQAQFSSASCLSRIALRTSATRLLPS